jgi:hypothetical protein
VRVACLSLLALLLGVSTARADIILYQIPNTNLAVVIQGKVTVHPGLTATVRHARFGNLHFHTSSIRYWKVESTDKLATRKLNGAVHSENAEQCIEAARWALHNGELETFYDALSAAWKFNPQHPTVLRLGAMKRRLDTPIALSTELEKEVRGYIANDEKMQLVRSKHFLLLHDTSAEIGEFSKVSRAQERLHLLETVYESFLMKFCLEGYDLSVPTERLKVVLFSDRKDYLASGETDIEDAAGFYTKIHNTAVFYDQGTNTLYTALDILGKLLERDKALAIRNRTPNAKHVVRLANTIRLLTRVSRENADIEVVSHEATHHMAAVTGLLPNDSPVAVWAHEGLATYFESPSEAAWSGIGTVNDDRLDLYRVLARDPVHSGVPFVCSDRIFSHAATMEGVAHGYGQAWALTHFLMDQHFKELIEYYRIVAEIKSEKQLTPEKYEELFKQAFGSDLGRLEADWRDYMEELRTDLEIVLGS